MTQSQQELADTLMRAALNAGADAADAVALAGASVSIDVRNGKLEMAERSEATELGLRVFIGKRSAITSVSSDSMAAIEAMAERAVAMAREAPEDPHVGLADPDQLAQGWNVDALEMADPSPEPDPSELENDALAAEAAGLAVSGVSQVQSANAGYGAQSVSIASSNGFTGSYSRTSRSRSCVAIAGTGTAMERDYDGDSRVFQSDLRSAAEIGKSAGDRAVERLNARKPETGTYPVLFDERISSSLIGHLLSAANGAAIARGSSWLQESLGKQVLPETLSLIEDPHRPRASGSRPFDGEGLPTQRRTIVENGVLTGWALDLASARKLSMTPTGSAGRGVSSPPTPTYWNVELSQGEKSRADLIAGMGTGLLVTSMIGSTINPNTGDYSRGAAGFWIENGEIAYPVNECTIAGNLHDMLRRIIPANDARSWLSRVVPSLLIESMTLAGN